MKEKCKEKLFVFIENLKKQINKFRKLSIEKKAIVISISIFVVSLFIMMFTSRSIDTKEKVIIDFKTAIESENVKLLSKSLKVDDKHVNYKSLVPLMEYYKDKGNTLVDITKQLRVNNKSGILEIKNKKNIFGNNYYININRISVEVQSNFNNTEISIDNKNVKSGELLKDIIPGNYVAKYKLNTEFGYITGEEEVTITEGSIVKISVNAGNITLYSDYKDADVFIENKDIGKKVEDIVDFGPIPLDKDIKIYIEKEFPWGKIKSETVSINDGGIIKIDINMINEELMKEINIALNTFFNSVFYALNEEDKSLIENADESTKDKIYDDIFKKTLVFTNNYKISDMNLNIEKSEFNYGDETYEGNVVVKINYDIYKKVLPFIKEKHNEMFLVGLIYENGNWLAKDIQRVNIYD